MPINAVESAGFLHSWQVTAHMLGEYIPNSWATANTQAAQVLTPILAPTPEGIKLADILVNLASFIDGSSSASPSCAPSPATSWVTRSPAGSSCRGTLLGHRLPGRLEALRRRP
nr:hypothetical protein [Parafrankia sp. CH37]